MDHDDAQIRALPHCELLALFQQLREEYADFQTSSLEMEKMMDAELEESKTNLKRAETRVQMLQTENDRAKTRHDETRHQWCQVEEQLRTENAQLREQCDRQKTTICRLEQRNDVLEASDRNKEFMASDLGKKLDMAIEKIAMLESELYERQVAHDEMHRLRIEELRTSTERPRLIVEPLRNEALPDEPSPGPSKTLSIDEDVCMEVGDNHHNEDVSMMEETVTRIEQVNIDEKRAAPSGSVNQIVRSLISKVERLENVLSSIKLTTSKS